MKKKLLVVIDMQNDFVTGALSNPAAQAVIPTVKAKLKDAYQVGDDVIFTRDTHDANYMNTQEGKFLPVPHCIKGTQGWEIVPELVMYADTADSHTRIVDKPTFGSFELAELAAQGNYDEIEVCGVCTDICDISNILILKTKLPETPVKLDSKACAGITAETHAAAISVMKMCQVIVTE